MQSSPCWSCCRHEKRKKRCLKIQISSLGLRQMRENLGFVWVGFMLSIGKGLLFQEILLLSLFCLFFSFFFFTSYVITIYSEALKTYSSRLPFCTTPLLHEMTCIYGGGTRFHSKTCYSRKRYLNSCTAWSIYHL